MAARCAGAVHSELSTARIEDGMGGGAVHARQPVQMGCTARSVGMEPHSDSAEADGGGAAARTRENKAHIGRVAAHSRYAAAHSKGLTANKGMAAIRSGRVVTHNAGVGAHSGGVSALGWVVAIHHRCFTGDMAYL